MITKPVEFVAEL